jgi:predicted acyltransferase
VLFAGGAGALVLAGLHAGLDDGRASPLSVRISEPLVALGRNAMLLFVVSGLVAKTLVLATVSDGRGGQTSLQARLYEAIFAPLATPKLASLIYAVTCLALLYALLSALHKRRWYWSV